MPSNSTSWVALNTLVIFPGNPRRLTEEQKVHLMNSVIRFSKAIPGWKEGSKYRLVDPIIVNDHNQRIVGGNQRVLCLGLLEQDTIHKDDIRWVHIEDEQSEMSLNVALNKISGEWDDRKLLDILTSMEDDFIELSGFTKGEVEDLFESLDDDAPLVTEEEDKRSFYDDDFVDFHFGDYRGNVGRAVYDAFVVKYKELQGEKEEAMLDDVLRGWLDIAS